ncbi:MAG: transglutaminase domain-containing protein [Cyclobacteriaceae bacterium]
MQTYTPDSSAIAVVLDEFGEVYFDNDNGNMIIEYHKKIKVLRKEGVEQANFSILLRKGDSRKEEMKSVEGITYYFENGNVKNSALDKKAIFYEENPAYTQVKFTLPNAVVGSTLEVKYIISSPFIFNLYPWEFQSDIPKVQSEFWALIPGNYSYNAALKGFLKLTTSQTELVKECFSFGSAKADCSLLKYGMKNIPAFKEEEFMTAKSNFLSAINFELEQIKYFDGRVDKITKEWKDVEEELQTHADFGTQIKKARNLFEKEISPLLVGVTDPLEKAKKIYNWIKPHYSWNDYLGKYTENGVKKSFETKKGNVGDINLSLLGALQAAELSANPVLLSTRANGLPNSLYPVLSDFNYVVVQLVIGENSYLLDATDHFMPFGLLPEMCLNGKGRLLAKKNSLDIDLIPKGKEKSVTTISVKLNEEGALQGSLQINAFDYQALESRKKIMSYSNREDYIKALEKRWNAKEIKNYEVTNLQELEKNLAEKMEITFDAHDATNVQQIYFNPFIAGRWTDNPFKSTERTFPVDFGVAQEETVLLTLEYPVNFHLDEVPKNIALAMPNKGGKFLFQCVNLGNKLTISYSLSLTKAIYDAQEYHSLKELFARIVQLRQTDLVLIKNN